MNKTIKIRTTNWLGNNEFIIYIQQVQWFITSTAEIGNV